MNPRLQPHRFLPPISGHLSLRHVPAGSTCANSPARPVRGCSHHIPPEGYRGLHRLNKFPEGRIKCVACEMCSAACPADCIHIIPGPSPWDEGNERYPVRFDIDLLRCIFCGFCEMACPEEAIELTEIYDFSDYTREDLIIDKDGLLEVFELTKDQKYYSRKNDSQEPQK